MLRICEKLREADAKARRLGLVRTETDYLRALVDAMADMDRAVEVEVLKSLGDVNLEKGQLDKDGLMFDRAMLLYRAALLRCKDKDMSESLENRYLYAEKLRVGKRGTFPNDYEPQTNGEKMYSPAKISEKFSHLDHRRLTSGYDKDFVLLEYTKLMIEGVINEDNLLETEAIKSFGDVFLKRGTETGDTPCLTKATALYNTALARSPSDYISSLTPKHAPDYRSYEKCLTTGDRALGDGNLDSAEHEFAAALKLIHDPNIPDRLKETDCLCRLGDVYVQRGKTTREGRNFTQAAALYNAAMARTDKNKQCVTKILYEIEQRFLRYTANVDGKSILSGQAIRHKKRLEDMRAHTKSQLEAIDQRHNPYQYDEDDPSMKTVEVERAEAVKALFKAVAQDRQNFIQDLVDECIVALGPPPCKYAFIGLGSQATELVTPYSDLEFAILIEDGKDNDDTRRYFLNLTHYLHLKVINLGETILPAMAIPSLNDFQSENLEKDWFFDSVTPRGFAFDGFMPWASKTPFGRDKTKRKPQVSLIQTPAEMATFQRLDVSLSEGYHLSDILRRFVFLAGEEALVDEYRERLSKTITDDLLSHFKSHLSAIQILYDDRDHFHNLEPTGQLLNVKKDIYRFPGIAIELLALCCHVALSSAWDVIDRLKELGKIGEENATHLKVLTSISVELRLRTYMANGGQKDNLSPLAQMKYQSEAHEVPDSILRLGDQKKAITYYKESLAMKRTIYRDNTANPSIAASLHGLGSSWSELGDQKKAVGYFEEALTIEKTIYGDNTAHPDIAAALQALGSSWSELGDQKKAIGYFEEVLTIEKTIYGENTAHPDIAQSLHNIGG
ncbi:Hypp3827 [Branchiostoma lanceolatum]|uniref:Hypp3827 protein n=1 Tax=Branchiostoma lanceolatum TaxID=7740 RepID=A0A8K0A3U6_BRALA|nr:Hypp3827 [Branchiostoma lanceolatum]